MTLIKRIKVLFRMSHASRNIVRDQPVCYIVDKSIANLFTSCLLSLYAEILYKNPPIIIGNNSIVRLNLQKLNFSFIRHENSCLA